MQNAKIDSYKFWFSYIDCGNDYITILQTLGTIQILRNTLDCKKMETLALLLNFPV